MMSDEATIATLAATLAGVQKSQDESKSFNMHAFQTIMTKLDVLPKMQTDLAVGNERMNALQETMKAHSKTDEDMFKAQEVKIKELENSHEGRITALEKQGWIQKGAAMVVGGIAGLGASFLHR